MSDKEHKLIGSLKQQLADKVMDRREFVRYATLLGMAAPTAYMWAGKITGEDFVSASPRRRNADGRRNQDRPARAEDRQPAHLLVGL